MKGKIVILGTSSATPTKDRNHPSVFFSYLGRGFLFDCGEGTQRQLLKADISFSKIEKIFISHFHGDHLLGLPALLQTFSFHEKKEIELYGPKGLREIVENMLKISYFENVTKIDVFEIKSLDLNTIIDEKIFKVESIGLNHSVPCIAFSFQEKEYFKYNKQKIKELNLTSTDFIKLREKGFIEKKGRKIFKEELGFWKRGLKITYVADTYKTENIFKISQNSDYLVIESTYFDEEDLAKEYKHLTFQYIIENYEELKEIGVKKVILTHFSQRYKDLKLFKEELKKRKIEDIILGYDFLQFSF